MTLPAPETSADGYSFETLSAEWPARGVLRLVLDRPERLNAIDVRMFDELRLACERIAADDSVRVVILTGAGRGFCAGLDLADAARLPEMGVAEMLRAQAAAAAAVAGVRELPRPVIAAVNGPAAGGGLALALAADVRIAAPEARFGVAFIRLGLSGCDVGVSWLLPRVVGMGHASELMLTGRVIGAERAAEIGLVNELVGAGALEARSLELAAEISRNSAFGLQLTKEVLQLGVDAPSLAAAIAIENRNQVLASRTPEMREAMRAFMESKTSD